MAKKYRKVLQSADEFEKDKDQQVEMEHGKGEGDQSDIEEGDQREKDDNICEDDVSDEEGDQGDLSDREGDAYMSDWPDDDYIKEQEQHRLSNDKESIGDAYGKSEALDYESLLECAEMEICELQLQVTKLERANEELMDKNQELEEIKQKLTAKCDNSVSQSSYFMSQIAELQIKLNKATSLLGAMIIKGRHAFILVFQHTKCFMVFLHYLSQ